MLGKFRSQLASGIEDWMIPAAKCEYSRRFSLKEFFSRDSRLPPIALVQLNPGLLEVERPIATNFIRAALEEMMKGGATTRRKEKFLVIDDLNFYRKIPKLVDVTELLRAQGGVIIALSQSYEGLQSKASYGDEAEALVNNFPFQVYLGTGSGKAAKWIAEQFGEEIHYEEQFGKSFGGESIQGREDRRRSVEKRLKTAEILELPPASPTNGVTMHLKTPIWGIELAKHLPWHQIIRRHPPQRDITLHSLPERYQQITFWRQQEVSTLLSRRQQSRVSAEVTSPAAVAANLRLFEEELTQCLHDMVQMLGDPTTGLR
jgi:hypothetical protein